MDSVELLELCRNGFKSIREAVVEVWVLELLCPKNSELTSEALIDCSIDAELIDCVLVAVADDVVGKKGTSVVSMIVVDASVL